MHVFNEDDAIQEYEKQGLAKSKNLDADKLLTDSLQKLDHVRKLEVLRGKNSFHNKKECFLMNYFKLRH